LQQRKSSSRTLFTTASGLLPADYCQLEVPFDVQRTCAGIKTGML
jgi:hypothetical protein